MLSEEKQTRFANLRRQLIAREFSNMNPRQLEGVLATEGPLLLLAGAGSGKTTVLIHRIANLLRYGRGSDSREIPDYVTEEDLAFLEEYARDPDPAPQADSRARLLCALEPAAPWQVIAITFTNKAAGELKQRLEDKIGPEARDVWAATFHSACVRILRRYIEQLGYPSSFTIYDTDDSLRVIKESLKELNMDDKSFPPRAVLSTISRAKDEMLLAQDFLDQSRAKGDYRQQKIANVYLAYEKKLRAAGALDFDDIILHTVRLLQQFPEAREYYQNKFRYVLIDEYQDTNHLQYLLAALLAGGRKNICVVGDDDQSIYRFRGANIENILSFESQYAGCRTIRLEQNYRSTQNILDAANAVIRNNTGRKGKTLWTESGAGEKVLVKTVFNESDEASFVAGQIMAAYAKGSNWRDSAILYRMNAQSNALEMALKRSGVPYRVYGGMKFFDRAEVKDMLAYLCVVNNPADDLRLRRIINVPARGIGNTTVDKVQSLATQEGRSLYQIIRDADRYPALKSAAGKLRTFSDMIEGLRSLENAMELPEFYDLVCERSGYIRALEEKGDMESRGRIENVQELRSSVMGFLDSDPEDRSLAGFLDTVALYTDLDDAQESDNCVSLMTMHSAKGLEFPTVYVVGMEEGVFPGGRAAGDSEEMEEERRLCYVAMTRARERLVMTTARQRMLYGRTTNNMPSRFLEEIPTENMDWQGKADGRIPRNDWGEDASFGGSGFSGRTFGQQERRETAAPRTYGSAASRSNQAGRSAAAGFTAVPSGKGTPLLQLQKGDRVRHRSFGEGLVVSVRPMGNDALVEVSFDKEGTKRLMLRTAGPLLTKL